VKINIPFGAALTQTAHLPKGSIRMLKDPYAGTSKAAKITFWVIVVVLIAAAVTSYILWTNGTLKSWFQKPEPQKQAVPADTGTPAQTAPAPVHTERYRQAGIGSKVEA
jgi:hypothetical protein